MTIEVRRYEAAIAEDWRRVLSRARNGIFQFDRNFIEYHGDRFLDMSAVAYMDNAPVAVVPAAYDAVSHRVTSHPGLTFGGVVVERGVRSGEAIAIVNEVLDTFKNWGAKSCLMKLLPDVFGAYPSAEVGYALWRRGFALVRRDLSSLLPFESALPFNSLKNRAVKKAHKAGVTVKDAPVGLFHDLLESVLNSQHGVSAVHSSAELDLLKHRFPDHVFVRAGWLGGDILAGTLVFNYGHVWHTQYLANSARGRDVGALDVVIAELIDEAKAAGAHYMSFGASTTEHGMEINHGLLWQKESYGARAIVHDFMEGLL